MSKLNVSKLLLLLLFSGLACLGSLVMAQDQAEPVAEPTTVAVLGVYEKGQDVKDLGGKLEALLVAMLTTRENLILVERAELDKVISELELNLSGMVDPKTATQIGHMTGANVLVTAATFQVNGMLYVVAKVISTETTRVFGVSVKGAMEDLDSLIEGLAEDINKTIVERRAALIVPKKADEDRLAALKAKIGKASLPVLAVNIPEKHVGRLSTDPAAQTELIYIFRTLGFTVLDGKNPSSKRADLNVSGSALSEFAMQRQNLIGIRARIEITVKDTNAKVLLAERQTISKVALTEQIASKVALEEAAMDMAERLVPKLLEQWSKR